MTNFNDDEKVNPQERIDEDYQLFQVENNIFRDGDEPQRDNRFRCYEYSLFLFYRCNEGESENFDFHLINNWNSSGHWRLGNYKVFQFDGIGPISNVDQNYNIIKREMDRLKNLGRVEDYRLRKRYPELP